MSVTFTPYAAAKLVNAALKEYGVIDGKTGETKQIPPQMMYNYSKKGYIETVEGKITSEGLQEWIMKYLTKLGVTFETVEENTEDQIEGQLSLEDIEVEDENTTELADAAVL